MPWPQWGSAPTAESSPFLLPVTGGSAQRLGFFWGSEKEAVISLLEKNILKNENSTPAQPGPALFLAHQYSVGAEDFGATSLGKTPSPPPPSSASPPPTPVLAVPPSVYLPGLSWGEG